MVCVFPCSLPPAPSISVFAAVRRLASVTTDSTWQMTYWLLESVSAWRMCTCPTWFPVLWKVRVFLCPLMKIQDYFNFHRKGPFSFERQVLRYMHSLPFWTVGPYWAQILAWSASEAISKSWPCPLTVGHAQSMLAEPRNRHLVTVENLDVV